MNRNKIETFAKMARIQLQEQISSKIDQIQSGANSLVQIENPVAVKSLNCLLAEKGQKKLVEECAYIWFNRLCALRFMDAHRYNPTFVVTPKEGRMLPEILSDAMAGVIDESVNPKDRIRIDDLLSGALESSNAQSEIYRILLVSKCNDLSKCLPGLFEKIEDYTDILLPDDLLSTDSIVMKMLSALDDENCESIEVIGWLYQYYISERKDEVMKKKTISKEDMAAATQLFTPDWIVRYLVENSIGRLWILNHPDSHLAEKMEFYVKPAQQEESFVKIEDPSEFKVCDPCCGSGHMLVYSFDVLFDIYEEFGYPAQDAVASIIKNNLFGIELDSRAGQLTYFALMMKAREKDKRFLTRQIKPNVCVLEAIKFSDEEVNAATNLLKEPSLSIINLLRQFEHADEFGSLIVPAIKDITEMKGHFADNTEATLFDSELITRIEKVFAMTEYLSPRYNIVITNPPYLGKFEQSMKDFAQKNYPDSKADEFAMFMERDWMLCVKGGYSAMVNMQSWMFLSSYEKLRKKVLSTKTILSMIHIGARGFDSISGEVVSTTAFISKSSIVKDFRGQYFRIVDGQSEAEKQEKYLYAVQNHDGKCYFEADQSNFCKIPGSPIAYWVSERFANLFAVGTIGDCCKTREGLSPADNERFLRLWSEVAIQKINTKWIKYQKGGEYRKWYGNNYYLVNWENDGYEIKHNFDTQSGRLRSHNLNGAFGYREGFSWTAICSSTPSFRYVQPGFLFDSAGSMGFVDKWKLYYVIGILNSLVAKKAFLFISPTMKFMPGQILQVPFDFNEDKLEIVNRLVANCISLCKTDWDSFETSWDFKRHPLVCNKASRIVDAYAEWEYDCNERFNQLKANEEELNRIFIDIYGLQDELTPEESDSDVTVRKADLKRDVQSFISYAVGCMFGRYSLDYEGLAYAGGDWDSSKYATFLPDEDNVIPVLDDEWFSDDIVS
ncbi:MAG: BREX-1 system adenine-specific DNA-methyltransferase PglX, partial [Candidatus Cloacimonetes bacterium]|nr:BREX-1 system adenine-specific DNA-methyltransferase PglX [Candidatus Cloacimonadota bacterium]